MKKLTKIAAVLTMMTVAMTSLTACGGGNDKGGAAMTAAATTAATTKAPKTNAGSVADAKPVENAEIEAAKQFVDALSHTVWAGIDTDYAVSILGFVDNELTYVCDDGEEFDGYWAYDLANHAVTVYEDDQYTKPVGVLDMVFDLEHEVLILNDDLVLTETEAENLEDVAAELTKMSTAAKYLNNTYWGLTYDALTLYDAK